MHLQRIRVQALLNIISKEFTQLGRDIRSVIIIVLIPLFLLIIFGYGVTTDIKNVNLVICNFDKTGLSRSFIEKFTSSGFFSPYGEVESIDAVDRYLISGKVKVGVIIPANFSNEVGAGRPVKVQIIIDGSDANTANVILGYVQQIVQSFSSEVIVNFIFKRTGKLISSVELRPRIWFNPELKSVNFFIPGLMSLIMMIMTVLMTSLSISRERELGSFEKLISTPLNPFFIITGKAIPYAVLAFFDSILILLAGRILFGLEVKGSLSLLLLITAVFIICGLNLGLIISTITKSQQATMAVAFISTVVPTFVLSDFVFPIKNMPIVLRLISYFIPARYYLEIIRGVILKGNGILEHISSISVLFVFMVWTFGIGTIRLKKLMREI